MARIVCDQIHHCLDASELAATPSFSPHAGCVTRIADDCVEDGDDPALQPTNYARCLLDLEAQSCPVYGDFSCVARDFPPSCANLRALDTGLGIAEICD
jgi:hypothetical protein